MREIHANLAPYWLAGLIEAASVDGGPTDETTSRRARTPPSSMPCTIARTESWAGPSSTSISPTSSPLALADQPIRDIRGTFSIPTRLA